MLPGYDPDVRDDFTSIEEIAAELFVRGIERACRKGK